MKTVEKSSCEEEANAGVPTATGKFNLKLFKGTLLMLVRAKCKTNFATKN